MEDRVGRDGEATTWDKEATPAAAKSYYLRVLSVGGQAGARNLREMATLCETMDHLALGRSRQAADTLMQRLKALRVAAADGHWERAKYLELIEADRDTLVSKDDEHLMGHEANLNRRLGKGGSSSSGKGWWNSDGNRSDWNERNKGKSAKGGKKNGRAKGKKNPWRQPAERADGAAEEY